MYRSDIIYGFPIHSCDISNRPIQHLLVTAADTVILLKPMYYVLYLMGFLLLNIYNRDYGIIRDIVKWYLSHSGLAVMKIAFDYEKVILFSSITKCHFVYTWANSQKILLMVWRHGIKNYVSGLRMFRNCVSGNMWIKVAVVGLSVALPMMFLSPALAQESYELNIGKLFRTDFYHDLITEDRTFVLIMSWSSFAKRYFFPSQKYLILNKTLDSRLCLMLNRKSFNI